MTYAGAGVSIDAGDELVRRIKPHAARTMIPGVLAGIGGFGALFEMPSGMREPVLVSGTDGVGTKLKLAFLLDGHDGVGQDLVAMSVNDILVQGARPLFFLDYFACGRLDVAVAERVVAGIARGCEQAGCALIGGETAEMPGMYPDGEYDLAGFAVGVVEKSAIIDGSTIGDGDVVLGLASSGPHSNGYSLIRRIVESAGADYHGEFGAEFGAEFMAEFDSEPEGKLGRGTLARALLAPTRIYCKPVLAVLARVAIKGMAHITGGGLLENVPRVLPDGMQAVLHRDAWTRPPIFDWLQDRGRVDEQEMHRVFNCGIGMAMVVARSDAGCAVAEFAALGETCWEIGSIRACAPDAPACVVI